MILFSICCCFTEMRFLHGSDVTESKLGQVRFQDFWAYAFCVNRDSSAISPRLTDRFPHFCSFLRASSSRYIISPFLTSFKTLRFKTPPLKYFAIPLPEAATGGILKKSSLKNFAKFTRKHFWRSLFFNKNRGLKQTQVFSCGFGKIFKNISFA